MPVQWGTNPAVSQSVFLLRGTHAARPAAAPANQDYYYWEDDTPGGALFQSNGLAWVQLIGGAQSDGAGGTTLPGPITVNSPTAPAATEFSRVNGSLNIYESPGTLANGDGPLFVNQGQALNGDNFANALQVFRRGDTTNGSYTDAVVTLFDFTDSTQPMLYTFSKVGGVGAQRTTLGKTGGVGQYGVLPPDAQPIGGAATAGATYTAAEQTMLQALYDAARATGMLS